MKKPRVVFSLVACGAVVASCHADRARVDGPPHASVAPPSSSTPDASASQPDVALPEAPSQHVAWATPSTKLTPRFVSAVVALFDEGLADPRGLEYREVEIAAGNVWSGDAKNAKTHAWAFSKADVGYAVAWNGLVYKTASVGARADVAADIDAIVAADERERAKYAKENPGHDFYRFRHAWPEEASIAHATLLPIKVALLLRVGEVALAERAWGAWTAGMREDTNDDAKHLNDPFLMLATDFAWALFDRAVCAHMRGDDPLSLASANLLSRAAAQIDAEAARRGIARPSSGGGDKKEPPYLGFLDGLDVLREDEARRLMQAGRKPVLARGLESIADKKERVAALIGDLDLVAARQWGQPGGVSLGEDPIVQAIVAQGEDAVPALLECLEKDERLTRSVHFWRDFAHHRSLLSVGEAAYVALASILQASFFGAASTGDDLSARGIEGRRKVAEQVRAYWEKWRGVSMEERWFRTLAADDAGLERWLEAAANIAQPENVTVMRSGMVWSTTMTTSAGTTPPKLRGESLRSKVSPSVTDLLARRVNDLPIADACRIVHYLAVWDPKPAMPTLQRQSARALAEMGSAAASKAMHAGCFAQIAIERADAGDRSALGEYAAWVAPLAPSDLGSSSYTIRGALEPMWHYPDDAAIVRASNAMFARAGSPWMSLVKGNPQNFWGLAELAESPLVAVPAFRRLVIASLADKGKVGTLVAREGGGISVALDNGGSMGTGADASDAPPAGTTRIMRACDIIGWEVTRHDSAPHFRLYWPDAQRDAALRDLARFLTDKASARPTPRTH